MRYSLKKPCVKWTLDELYDMRVCCKEKIGRDFLTDRIWTHTSFTETKKALDYAVSGGMGIVYADKTLTALYGTLDDLLLLVNETPASLIPHIVSWRFAHGK